MYLRARLRMGDAAHARLCHMKFWSEAGRQGLKVGGNPKPHPASQTHLGVDPFFPGPQMTMGNFSFI